MTMSVLLIVDDAQDFVCCENCRALVTDAERALPVDSVGSVVHSIINVAILSENVQLQTSLVRVLDGSLN